MKKIMEVNNLTVDIGNLRLLDKISFSLWENDRLMIIGPNGAGKSTLLQALSQGLPYKGEVFVEEQNVRRLSPNKRARLIGVFSQHHEVNYGFTVEEIVRLGRYAYSAGIFEPKDQEAERLIEEGLRITGLYEKRCRSVLTLSGGELQRVFLAQLLAQDPQIMLLDEPTNHLDIQYQQLLHGILNEWAQQNRRAVMAVIHDLSLARLYGNKLLLLNEGKMVAYGRPEEVLTRKYLSQVYKMDVYSWMEGLYEPWGEPI